MLQGRQQVALVNPARAGMIRPIPARLYRATCKPRASGDDPGDLGRSHSLTM